MAELRLRPIRVRKLILYTQRNTIKKRHIAYKSGVPLSPFPVFVFALQVRQATLSTFSEPFPYSKEVVASGRSSIQPANMACAHWDSLNGSRIVETRND